MMHAYMEDYVDDAATNLGDFFDYGINQCGYEADLFAHMFLLSRTAKQFEQGNPAYVAGMSGFELAFRVIERTDPQKNLPEVIYYMDKSPEYWAGWVLAQYQWEYALRFVDIFRKTSFSLLLERYHPYHEMDISQIFRYLEDRRKKGEIGLKEKRLVAGLSQRELADRSGVNIRNIQLYEQKQNDITKAQGGILLNLARVLRCSMEDLL